MKSRSRANCGKPTFFGSVHYGSSLGTQIDCPESHRRCTGVDGMGSGPEFDFCVIIDDDDDILMASRLLLRGMFNEVATARSPDEALPLIRERTPDVVLLDANFARGATNAAEGLAWLEQLLAID